MPDEIISLLQVKPKLLERKSIIQRITDKISEFIETYITGVITSYQTDEPPNNVALLKEYDVDDKFTVAAEE